MGNSKISGSHPAVPRVAIKLFLWYFLHCRDREPPALALLDLGEAHQNHHAAPQAGGASVSDVEMMLYSRYENLVLYTKTKMN